MGENTCHVTRGDADRYAESRQYCSECLVSKTVQRPQVGSPVGMAQASAERKQAAQKLTQLPQSYKWAEGRAKDCYHAPSQSRKPLHKARSPAGPHHLASIRSSSLRLRPVLVLRLTTPSRSVTCLAHTPRGSSPSCVISSQCAWQYDDCDDYVD